MNDYINSMRGRLLVACINLMSGTVLVMMGALNGDWLSYGIAAMVYFAAVLNLYFIFEALEEK